MAKYTQRKRVTRASLDCGCLIIERTIEWKGSTGDVVEIEFCSTHKAAPEMYEALKMMQAAFDTVRMHETDEEAAACDATRAVLASIDGGGIDTTDLVLHGLGDDGLNYCIEEDLQDKLSKKEIDGIVAEIPGEADGADWHWLIKLKDSRFGYVVGGCDYTGWG